MDAILAITTLITAMYLIIFIGEVTFIFSRKRGAFNKNVEPIPVKTNKSQKEMKEQ